MIGDEFADDQLLERLKRAGRGLRFWRWLNDEWVECSVVGWWYARRSASAACRSSLGPPQDSRVAARTRRAVVREVAELKG